MYRFLSQSCELFRELRVGPSRRAKSAGICHFSFPDPRRFPLAHFFAVSTDQEPGVGYCLFISFLFPMSFSFQYMVLIFEIFLNGFILGYLTAAAPLNIKSLVVYGTRLCSPDLATNAIHCACISPAGNSSPSLNCINPTIVSVFMFVLPSLSYSRTLMSAINWLRLIPHIYAWLQEQISSAGLHNFLLLNIGYV